MIEAAITDMAKISPSVGSRELPALLPLLGEFRRQIGNPGKTLTYEIVDRLNVEIVRVGARSMVPRDEVPRVVAALRAESAVSKARKGGRELAAKSVAARGARILK
jgi:hypothetical protein